LKYKTTKGDELGY